MAVGARSVVHGWMVRVVQLTDGARGPASELGEVGDCGMGLAPSMQVRQVSDRIMEFSSLLVMWSARSTV